MWDACHVGTPVMWGCLSCGDACHVGMPVMWGCLSCGDACHVGMPVMRRVKTTDTLLPTLGDTVSTPSPIPGL